MVDSPIRLTRRAEKSQKPYLEKGNPEGNSADHKFILVSDGKYHVLPNGDLLVHNIQFSDDEFKRYRCRTMHKLTRAVVASGTAYIKKIGKLLH